MSDSPATQAYHAAMLRVQSETDPYQKAVFMAEAGDAAWCRGEEMHAELLAAIEIAIDALEADRITNQATADDDVRDAVTRLSKIYSCAVRAMGHKWHRDYMASLEVSIRQFTEADAAAITRAFGINSGDL